MNYHIIVGQLPLLVSESKTKAKSRISSPSSVADVCKDMINMAQESCHVLCLNAKGDMIKREMVTLGIADASLMHPREIFRSAILANASVIVLVHNHPSGYPTPSAEDIRITKQMVEAGKIIDIKVLDHVIVSSSGHISMAEQGLVTFNKGY